MPTNLYGPNDNFDLASSHVLPALLVKAHRAKLAGTKELTVWGSGTPRREFLHVDDLADACIFLMQHYSADEHINVGYGSDVTIRELATLISQAVGFGGTFVYDSSKPDGTPQKLMDVSRLSALGWRARTSLPDGIAATYKWYLENAA
jgi:GDP-L-fucose synthase